MVEERHLKAEHIYRVYENSNTEQVQVLDDFDLEVKHGEIVAIVGPSGCGKSTFLRLAAGLDRPQAGQLTYNGKLIKGTDPDRGFVFQDPNLFPWLTVQDNVNFGLKARNIFKEQKDKVQEYIDLVGLSGFEDAYPYQLSGGMASRTSLARTFIQEPGMILLDEPLSALDAFTKAAIQNELLKIWEKNKPIILLVTHDIEEAVYLSDRIVIMSDRPGRVIGEVNVDIEHPRERVSPAFVQKRKEILEILENRVILKEKWRKWYEEKKICSAVGGGFESDPDPHRVRKQWGGRTFFRFRRGNNL